MGKLLYCENIQIETENITLITPFLESIMTFDYFFVFVFFAGYEECVRFGGTPPMTRKMRNVPLKPCVQWAMPKIILASTVFVRRV